MTATEVSEMLLEQTGQAMLRDDFEAFASCFALPHLIETPDKKIVLETHNELLSVFQNIVQDYKYRGVSSLIRYCEVAQFKEPGKVQATHISHVMSGDRRIMDPYAGFSVIDLIDGQWRLTATQYAVDTTTTFGKALGEIIEAGTRISPILPDLANNMKEM